MCRALSAWPGTGPLPTVAGTQQAQAMSDEESNRSHTCPVMEREQPLGLRLEPYGQSVTPEAAAWTLTLPPSAGRRVTPL